MGEEKDPIPLAMTVIGTEFEKSTQHPNLCVKFILKVNLGVNGHSVRINRCYTEISDLHSKLKSVLKKVSLPTLPKGFPKTVQENDLTAKSLEVTKYLNALVAIEAVQATQVWYQFIMNSVSDIQNALKAVEEKEVLLIKLQQKTDQFDALKERVKNLENIIENLLNENSSLRKWKKEHELGEESRINVSGIDTSIDEDALTEHFAKFGTLVKVNAITWGEDRRGFTSLVFKNEKDKIAVLTSRPHVINNRELTVNSGSHDEPRSARRSSIRSVSSTPLGLLRGDASSPRHSSLSSQSSRSPTSPTSGPTALSSSLAPPQPTSRISMTPRADSGRNSWGLTAPVTPLAERRKSTGAMSALGMLESMTPSTPRGRLKPENGDTKSSSFFPVSRSSNTLASAPITPRGTSLSVSSSTGAYTPRKAPPLFTTTASTPSSRQTFSATATPTLSYIPPPSTATSFSLRSTTPKHSIPIITTPKNIASEITLDLPIFTSPSKFSETTETEDINPDPTPETETETETDDIEIEDIKTLEKKINGIEETTSVPTTPVKAEPEKLPKSSPQTPQSGLDADFQIDDTDTPISYSRQISEPGGVPSVYKKAESLWP